MVETTVSEFYSADRTRHVVVVTKNDNTNLVYFYENNELINTVRKPTDILQAEQLAEDFTLGFLNPRVILG